MTQQKDRERNGATRPVDQVVYMRDLELHEVCERLFKAFKPLLHGTADTEKIHKIQRRFARDIESVVAWLIATAEAKAVQRERAGTLPFLYMSELSDIVHDAVLALICPNTKTGCPIFIHVLENLRRQNKHPGPVDTARFLTASVSTNLNNAQSRAFKQFNPLHNCIQRSVGYYVKIESRWTRKGTYLTISDDRQEKTDPKTVSLSEITSILASRRSISEKPGLMVKAVLNDLSDRNDLPLMVNRYDIVKGIYDAISAQYGTTFFHGCKNGTRSMYLEKMMIESARDIMSEIHHTYIDNHHAPGEFRDILSRTMEDMLFDLAFHGELICSLFSYCEANKSDLTQEEYAREFKGTIQYLKDILIERWQEKCMQIEQFVPCKGWAK